MNKYNSPSWKPQTARGEMHARRNDVVDEYQKFADLKSKQVEPRAAARPVNIRTESTTGYNIGPDDYDRNGKYKYETRESFVAHVPDVRQRIDRYTKLGRTVPEEDTTELMFLRQEERSGELDRIVCNKIKFEEDLHDRIMKAPASRKPQLEALRREFESRFNELSDEYLNSKQHVLSNHPQLKDGNFIGPVQVAEAHFKDEIIKNMHHMLSNYDESAKTLATRLERNSTQDKLRARELREVSAVHGQRLTILLKLWERTSHAAEGKRELAQNIAQEGEAYMRAISIEGSHLWKNLRGQNLPTESEYVYEPADDRIKTLLGERTMVAITLSRISPEKHAGKPATIQIISKNKDYLLRRADVRDMPQIEAVTKVLQDQFAALSQKTNAYKTTAVAEILKTPDHLLKLLDPTESIERKAELQLYLEAVQKEGSFLYQKHRETKTDRINELLAEQNLIKEKLDNLS